MYALLLTLILGVTIFWPCPTQGHGRLWDPPARATMWRRGYNTPIDWNDTEWNCGGFSLHKDYKCGVCGDPFEGPFENEAGGKYATGQITNTYHRGEEVTFQVDLTSNHQGYFEFKICPTNDPKKRETRECFDQHVVQLADGSGSKSPVTPGNNMKSIKVVLPKDLVCDFCVLQWRYHAGNNWGTDPDGTTGIGHGPQEEFYGCADIKIVE